MGHLGRIDHWLDKAHRGRHLPAQKTLREYMETNVFITTAGYFNTPPLLAAMTEIGVSRIMFSIDTPYENITEGSTWLDTLPISQGDIVKIGRQNALDLFPQLQRRLRSNEVEKLQKDRPRVLWTSQPGFEAKARI
jgi:2,3-dihydroxybenzoate decarboxylase